RVQMNPAEMADAALRQVLLTQWDGAPAVRLDSPPGAGKTGVVERVAVQNGHVMAERCMVATQTNEQAFDLARRLARNFPRLRFTLFVRDGLQVPSDLEGQLNLGIARQSAEVPVGPGVVIANAARWSWMDRTIVEPFQILIVDEAFQLADH